MAGCPPVLTDLFTKLVAHPGLLKRLTEPVMMSSFMDVSQNPGNITKYDADTVEVGAQAQAQAQAPLPHHTLLTNPPHMLCGEACVLAMGSASALPWGLAPLLHLNG